MEISIQLNVSDTVDVIDVFISYGKKWIEEVTKKLLRVFNVIFTVNNYISWDAILVRGPNSIATNEQDSNHYALNSVVFFSKLII